MIVNEHEKVSRGCLPSHLRRLRPPSPIGIYVRCTFGGISRLADGLIAVIRCQKVLMKVLKTAPGHDVKSGLEALLVKRYMGHKFLRPVFVFAATSHIDCAAKTLISALTLVYTTVQISSR